MTLDTAASFIDISLMGTDTGPTASNITLNFSDTSTTVVATSYSGWVNPGLIEPGLTNNSTGIGGVNGTRPDGFTGGIDVFTHTLTLVDQAKTLESITFSTSTDAVFAISGTVIPIPEPSSSTLLGLGGLALMTRRRK